MTHFSLSTLPSRVRFPNIAFFSGHAFHGPREYVELTIRNPYFWFVKVASTLCVRSTCFDTYLDYFGSTLNPTICFEVIKRLNNHPNVAFRFFEFSRVNLGMNYSFLAYNHMLRLLCHSGFHDSANKVFDFMRSDGHFPDSLILGFLVSSFAHAGKFDIAKGMIPRVCGSEFRMSSMGFNKLLSLLVKENLVEEAVELFREQLRLCFRADTCSFNIVIRGLCILEQVDRAFDFLNEMGSFGCSPDLFTYNALINGLCRINEVDRANNFLNEIQSKNEFSPDVVAYTSVISGYCKLGKLEEANHIFDNMISLGTRPNSITYNVLINGFGKGGDMLSALTMFENMIFNNCIPDVITFTSLIDGYCRIGQVDEGLKLWREMYVRNISPNKYTFAILINALCKENRLREARDFLRVLKNRGEIVSQPFMYNPVIDGFCKAGNVDEANVIVEEMHEKRCRPDKLTYTILIIGHCMKGRMFEAIDIFNKMLAVGCPPDTITVTSLISCLFKAGMPNEAIRIKRITSEDLSLGLTSLKRKRTTPSTKNLDIRVAV